MDSRPCGDGCVLGFECNPLIDLCVPRTAVSCESGGLCPTQVVTGSECSQENAFIPCSNDVEDCSLGCRFCEDGEWSECRTTSCTFGQSESCSSCDDNCSLQVQNAAAYCAAAAWPYYCTYSQCEIGYKDIDNDRSNGCETACTPSESGIESCNDVDDDCDGYVDEDISDLEADCFDGDDASHVHEWACVSGECQIIACDTDYWSVDENERLGCPYSCTQGTEGIEICDGVDNDCNGTTDDVEDLQAECEISEDPYYVDAWACVDGACKVDICTTMNWDIDGLVSTGCEYPCTPDHDTLETCDDQDNDCDGMTDNYAGGCWWDTHWDKRIKLTFDHQPSEDLVDFPLLVHLNTFVISGSEVDGSANDIRFLNALQNTVLDFEIEYFDGYGDSYLWVRVPRIPADGIENYIWLYFGNSSASNNENAAAVWDSNYAAVWHMDALSATGTGIARDSTSNDNDASANSSPSVISSQIYNAVDFDGSDDYLSVCSGDCDSSLGWSGDEYTLEAWIDNPSGGQQGDHGVIDRRLNGNDERYILAVEYKDSSSTDRLNCRTTNTAGTHVRFDVAGVPRDSWSYLVCRYDGSELKGFVDGAHLSGATAAVSGNIDFNSDDSVVIGKRYDSRFFEGAMDELRISKVARSDAWIYAQYLSMTQSFFSFGTKETKL
ncbi:DUF2341 domain-containing protein [Myxococcota bacterium]|nr:DUF2341 domain-containing protein [Myxococcota bacterium]